MPPGFLTPDPRLRELSDVGVVLPGALLHTYVSGSPSTPLQTTSDAAGLVPNLNPLVASAGGLFGPIYLTPGVAYKFVLTDAAGGPIWDQDPVGLGGVAQGGTGLTAGISGGIPYFSSISAMASSALLAAHGVVLGGGAGVAPLTTGAGSVGQALRSGGASADPAFGELSQQSALVGAQNPFPLTAGINTLYLNNATLITIQGFTAGYVGQRLTVFSIGAAQVDFTTLDPAAGAGTKLLNYATNGVTSLAPGIGSAEFVYDSSSRWRLVSHVQGDYINWTPTFSTNTTATWTGQATSASKYYLTGRKLHLIFEYNLSSVSAATAGELRFTLPSTMTSAGRSFQTIRTIDNGGAAVSGSVMANAAGDQFLRVLKDLTDIGVWAVSVSLTSVRGELVVNVQ